MPFLTKDQRVTDEKIRELEAAHGRITIVTEDAYPLHGEEIPPGAVAFEVVFRRAKSSEWKMFRKANFSESAREAANETLCMYTVVHVSGAPSGKAPRDAFADLMEDWPGVTERAGAIVAKISGFDANKRGE